MNKSITTQETKDLLELIDINRQKYHTLSCLILEFASDDLITRINAVQNDYPCQYDKIQTFKKINSEINGTIRI